MMENSYLKDAWWDLGHMDHMQSSPLDHVSLLNLHQSSLSCVAQSPDDTCGNRQFPRQEQSSHAPVDHGGNCVKTEFLMPPQMLNSLCADARLSPDVLLSSATRHGSLTTNCRSTHRDKLMNCVQENCSKIECPKSRKSKPTGCRQTDKSELIVTENLMNGGKREVKPDEFEKLKRYEKDETRNLHVEQFLTDLEQRRQGAALLDCRVAEDTNEFLSSGDLFDVFHALLSSASISDTPPLTPLTPLERSPLPLNSSPDRIATFACHYCDKEFDNEKYMTMHSSLHRDCVPAPGGASEGEAPTVVPPSEPSEGSARHPPGAARRRGVGARGTGAAGQGRGVGKAGGAGRGAGDWACEVCGKRFGQNSNFKNHVRTHSNERPHVCEICSIGFKERYHLKKHVLFKHTLELNEQCGQCGKRFKDSTAVRAHERTHSDLRPYACLRCGKAFKTSECLWHHDHRSKACGSARSDKPVQLAGNVACQRLGNSMMMMGNSMVMTGNDAVVMEVESSQAAGNLMTMGNFLKVENRTISVNFSLGSLENCVIAENLQKSTTAGKEWRSNKLVLPSQKINAPKVESRSLPNNSVHTWQNQHTAAPSLFDDVILYESIEVGGQHQFVAAPENGTSCCSSSEDTFHQSLTPYNSEYQQSIKLENVSIVEPLKTSPRSLVADDVMETCPPSPDSRLLTAYQGQRLLQHSWTDIGNDESWFHDEIYYGDGLLEARQEFMSDNSVDEAESIDTATAGGFERGEAAILQHNGSYEDDSRIQNAIHVEPQKMFECEDLSELRKLIVPGLVNNMALDVVKILSHKQHEQSRDMGGSQANDKVGLLETDCSENINFSRNIISRGDKGIDLSQKVELSGEFTDNRDAVQMMDLSKQKVDLLCSLNGGHAGGLCLQGMSSSNQKADLPGSFVGNRVGGLGVQAMAPSNQKVDPPASASASRAGELVARGRGRRSGGRSRSICAKCGKQFVSLTAYEKHMGVHGEQRPYRCAQCDIGFKLKVHLKKHNLYRHNSEYPCECSVCGKRFKDSSAVRLHERIHSAERPFKCQCGKSFKTKENLWGHRHRRPCDANYQLQHLCAPTGDPSPTLAPPPGPSPAPVPPLASLPALHPTPSIASHFVLSSASLAFPPASSNPIRSQTQLSQSKSMNDGGSSCQAGKAILTPKQKNPKGESVGLFSRVETSVKTAEPKPITAQAGHGIKTAELPCAEVKFFHAASQSFTDHACPAEQCTSSSSTACSLAAQRDLIARIIAGSLGKDTHFLLPQSTETVSAPGRPAALTTRVGGLQGHGGADNYSMVSSGGRLSSFKSCDRQAMSSTGSLVTGQAGNSSLPPFETLIHALRSYSSANYAAAAATVGLAESQHGFMNASTQLAPKENSSPDIDGIISRCRLQSIPPQRCGAVRCAAPRSDGDVTANHKTDVIVVAQRAGAVTSGYCDVTAAGHAASDVTLQV